MKLKIAFLGPAYPLRGGIAQFLEIMAHKLSEDHTVKIFSFKKQYPKLLFPGKDQIDRSDRQFDIETDETLIPYNPFTFIPTAQKINKYAPDVLILKYWIPFFAVAFGVILRLLNKKIKVIYVIDNIDFHEKWFAGDLLTKFALKPAAELITMSLSVYNDAVKLFPDKKVTLGFHPTYPHFNQNRFTPETAKQKLNLTDKKVILFFGYIKPYKGLDIIIKALPQILQKLPEAHLLIVGEVYGSDEIYLNLIQKLQLQEHITFVREFVKNEDVEQYFRASDVLALPYKQATQSGVAQVGYNFGVGSVATPVGGLPELVLHKKTGIVAESISEQDVAKAVIDFFGLDKAELKKNIAEENKKYSWDKFLEFLTTKTLRL